MLAQLPERQMHWVRWILTIGWLLVIGSLLYDPWTAALTVPDHAWSPLRISSDCVYVQGNCLKEAPYPLGATLFWGAIVPSGIFILLVFGHELWRRICPLSFLSQIPRALGWQRQVKRENEKTGKVRTELARVSPDSWLGRNYPYVQFGWLFIGLCGRILFFNSDRLVLALWILFAIAMAILVGYLYGGKSWCQYFCPMAPVQTIFSQPAGLLGSKAQMSEQRITQSMCRTVLPDGNEQSACVACQSPCFDIDSERTYWDGLNKPEESFIRYGYVGLAIGYFVYYYLYAGNWDYYFSGIWNRDPHQLDALMNPGLYLGGQSINIPKLFAVPLVLGSSTAIAIILGQGIENAVKSYARQHFSKLTPDKIRHRIFALCTFGIFNFFFFFAGRPLLRLLPYWVQFTFDVSIVFLSTLWLQKTWQRSLDLYSRESLASRFRKQLEKLQLNVSQFLEGRSLSDLNASEIYVLAKVLPGFNREKRHQAYKGVVKEALEEGYVNTSSSLEVLQQMRQELGISDDEHGEVLDELNIEDPEFLSPHRQRTLESQIRVSGYQKSLERLLILQQRQPDLDPLDQLLRQDSATIRSLRREYSITTQEEEWILQGISPQAGILQKAEFLLAKLSEGRDCDRALHHPRLHEHHAAVTVLHKSLHHKQNQLVQSILELLVTSENHSQGLAIAQSLKQIALQCVAEQINQEPWKNQLSPEIFQRLTLAEESPIALTTEPSTQETLSHLNDLLHTYNPLVQATALYLFAQCDPEQAQVKIRELQQASPPLLVQETSEQLLSLPPSPPLNALPRLEKLVYLSNSDFFHPVRIGTLMTLGDRAEIRTYELGGVITDAGDTCRELLLLIEGEAQIHYPLTEGVRVESLYPGQVLDELEVLGHSTLENTIIADSEKTRILAIPVAAFDDLLADDADFAHRVLELESRQIHRLMQSITR